MVIALVGIIDRILAQMLQLIYFTSVIIINAKMITNATIKAVALEYAVLIQILHHPHQPLNALRIQHNPQINVLSQLVAMITNAKAWIANISASIVEIVEIDAKLMIKANVYITPHQNTIDATAFNVEEIKNVLQYFAQIAEFAPIAQLSHSHFRQHKLF
jgi:hypothetical protein